MECRKTLPPTTYHVIILFNEPVSQTCPQDKFTNLFIKFAVILILRFECSKTLPLPLSLLREENEGVISTIVLNPKTLKLNLTVTVALNLNPKLNALQGAVYYGDSQGNFRTFQDKLSLKFRAFGLSLLRIYFVAGTHFESLLS